MEQTQNRGAPPQILVVLGLLAGLFSLTLTPPLGRLPAGLTVIVLKLFDHSMMAFFFWGAWKAWTQDKQDLGIFLAGGGFFWLGMNLWDLVLLASGNFR